MFYHGKGGGWRRQFIGVSCPNFFHGLSVNMISDHIPLIENFSMTSHKLLLGYSKEIEIVTNKVTTSFLILGHFEALTFL